MTALPVAYSNRIGHIDNTIRNGTQDGFEHLVRLVPGYLGQRLPFMANKSLWSMADCLCPTVTQRGLRHAPSRLPVATYSNGPTTSQSRLPGTEGPGHALHPLHAAGGIRHAP